MSYFISQESDQGFRIEPDDFIRRLQLAWPDAAVRPIDSPKRRFSHEWSISKGGDTLEGRLNRNRVSVVLDGSLPSAAQFAVWFQRNIAGEDKGLKFYDENYSPVVALKNQTTEAQIVDTMSKGAGI